MAIYDKDPDWVYNAVRQALGEDNTIEKEAAISLVNLSVDPMNIIAYGLNKIKTKGNEPEAASEAFRHTVEAKSKLEDSTPGFYSDINNVGKSIKVLFTPLGVSFSLNNTIVDIIHVDSMNSNMRNAWSNKDKEYFKTFLLNKMYLDAQVAEQRLVRKLLENELNTRQVVFNTPKEDSADIDLFAAHEGLKAFKKMANDALGNAALSKYACYVLNSFSKEDGYTIEPTTAGFKYAKDEDFDLGLTKLAVFWHTDPKADGILDKDEVKRDLNVSYLPDRVLYLSHDTVLTQKNVMDMEDDEYEAFLNKNDTYFKGKLVSGNIEKITQEDTTDEEKTAASDFDKYLVSSYRDSAKLRELFTANDIDPRIYLEFLTNKFGVAWLEWPAEAIETMLKDTLPITTISPAVFDKIMFIVTLKNSQTPLTGYHVFEKCIRSFNGKSVDFLERESSISLGEIVAGMRIMSDIWVTEEDNNMYDDISEPVLDYLVEVLVEQEYRACGHKSLSKYEQRFWNLVNLELIEKWAAAFPEGLGISNMKPMEEAGYICKAILAKDTDINSGYKYMVGIGIEDSQAVDVYWQSIADRYNKQYTKYIGSEFK